MRWYANGEPRRLISWWSYEYQKPPYIRTELLYKGRVYTGLGENAEQEIYNQLPRIPTDEYEVSAVWAYDWWIVYLHTEFEGWRCEGPDFWVCYQKLWARARRATYVPRGQDVE